MIQSATKETRAQFDVVFEGGGAKGVALVGALQVLIDGSHHSLRRLIGTSAGAITATLAAAGLPPVKMLEAVTERVDGRPRFQSFMDTPEAGDFSEAERHGSLTQDLCSHIDLPLVPRVIERQLDAGRATGRCGPRTARSWDRPRWPAPRSSAC